MEVLFWWLQIKLFDLSRWLWENGLTQVWSERVPRKRFKTTKLKVKSLFSHILASPIYDNDKSWLERIFLLHTYSIGEDIPNKPRSNCEVERSQHQRKVECVTRGERMKQESKKRKRMSWKHSRQAQWSYTDNNQTAEDKLQPNINVSSLQVRFYLAEWNHVEKNHKCSKSPVHWVYVWIL